VTLDWGEVDFQVEMPEEGYDPQVVTVTNSGTGGLDLTVVYDEDHLCIQGFESSPLTLPGLDEGSSYVLSVAVCGYQTGERDTEVTGQVRFRADGLYDEEVDWSFVPVRDLGVDTGS
jgi:hypothetical protein